MVQHAVKPQTVADKPNCLLLLLLLPGQVKEAPRAPSPPPAPKVEVGQSMIGGEVKRDPLHLIKVRTIVQLVSA
jgi:hypothetical protein